MNSEQTFTDPDTGIRFDWAIINCDGYIDCDIYAVMPTDEEYLLRVYREDASRSPFVGPFEEGCVRYSRNRTDDFDAEPPPDQLPESLRLAFAKIEPDVRALINSKLEESDELESHEAILPKPDTTPALVSALRELARHVDEDVPVEHRSKHLNNALAYAFELAEAFEETPTQPI